MIAMEVSAVKKRLIALLLCLTLLTSMSCAHAASLLSGIDVRLKMRLATRSGPGTTYTELGSYFAPGDCVTAVSRAYDERNGIWWVQVEFTYQKELYRAYTGHKRLDMALTAVPEEGSLGWYSLRQDAYAWNGPGTAYNMLSLVIPAGTWGEVITEEYGYVQFEYDDTQRGLTRRVWFPANELNGYVSSGWTDGWYTPVNQPQLWSSPAIGRALYREGDSHLIVLWVQSQLKQLGYYRQTDYYGRDTAYLTGYYDAITGNAIRRFQTAAGLTANGYVTQTLVDRILLHLQATGTPQCPVYVGGYYDALDGMYETLLYPGQARGREIRTMQTMLKALGYNVGSIDGGYGSKTDAAFTAWLNDKGMDGIGGVSLGHMRLLLEDFISIGGNVDDLPAW